MKIDILKAMPLFQDIERDILKKLIDRQSIRSANYKKNNTVHESNATCEMMDIVLEGSLVAYSLDLNGSTMTMFEFNQGSIIGANLIFGNQRKYPHNIYCLTDAKLVHVNRDAILELLHNYQFTLEYIKNISKNAQGINEKMHIFTQKTLRENILTYLHQQYLIQNKNPIILPITKKELADYFGVQRPSLFRELKKLKDEGIIAVDNRKITLLNI